MPIYRLLRDQAFGPEEIKILGDAFEDALRTLRLVNRDDPATEIVAKKIIELNLQGDSAENLQGDSREASRRPQARHPGCR